VGSCANIVVDTELGIERGGAERLFIQPDELDLRQFAKL
jgi:hypothetical protein